MSQLNRRLAHPETLKTLGLACGVVLVITFFLPYAEVLGSVVMSWDMASKVSKFAFLILYPIIAGAALIVMSKLPNVPHNARAIVTALAGLVPVMVFAFQIKELSNIASQGVPAAALFSLGLVALALGLTHRVVCSRSTAARVIVGLGMVLMALYFLIPQKVLFSKDVMPVVMLFKMLDSNREEVVVIAVLSLLPFFGLFGAGLALPKPTGNPALEKVIIGLAWFFLCYLPGLIAIMAVVVLVEKPGLHVVGLLNVAGQAAAYLTLLVFGSSHALMLLDTPDHSIPAPASPLPLPAHAPLDPPTASEPAWASLTCRTCGTAMEHGARFCEDCGAPASGATVPGPAANTTPDGPHRPLAGAPRNLVIGREASCDYVLPDNMDGASRQHARIFVQAGQITIEDLGSANGTFVNGKQITREPLKPTDRVRFGRTAAEVDASLLLRRMGL